MEHTIRPHLTAELYAACAEDRHTRCPVSHPVVPLQGPCSCSCHDPWRDGPS